MASSLFSQERIHIEGGEYSFEAKQSFYVKQKAKTLFVDSFYIDKYEVSNERYAKAIGEEMHYPVVSISYEDALSFCKKEGGSLPSEEEWMVAASFEDGVYYEYATKSYPIMDETDPNVVQERAMELEVEGFGADIDLVNVEDALVGNNKIVGMLGNVWEMVLSDTNQVILKGGSFYNRESPQILKSSVRSKVLKSRLDQYEHIGFRCVYKK